MTTETIEKSDLAEMTAAELSALYASGAASPVEVAQNALDRIERINPDVNAFTYVVPESALADAKASEERWRKGEALSPIDGAPTTLKELISVKGIPLRRGSILGETEPATKDLEIVERLRGAGVTILGTTASPKFGWKGLTHGPAYGNTLNPRHTGRASGGSSGDAAVCAALNLGVLHEGSDGAGSIRIPASFCGVFGIKPTFGWVPADASSALFELAHRDPLTPTVEDAALFLNATTGWSPRALYGHCPSPVLDWRKIVREAGNLKGLKLAYSPTLGYTDVDPEVAAAVEKAVGRLAEMGAVIEEVDPDFASPQEVLKVLWYSAQAKALSAFTPSEEQKALMDPGFVRICEKGTTFSALDYIAARQARADLTVLMELFFQKYDVLILPTMPLTAFEARVDSPAGQEGEDWSDCSPFTYPFNLTGQPAATVPCGLDADGLPIGLQVVAANFRDDVVLSLTAAYPTPFVRKPRKA
ncbi:amidase [Breoghania sp.]|uniref:amidase n=1 Tax=Breoghania sp. TaxID=2065378 RepID=UPI002629470E|nr:amidase [Breoghania sp.]MDJ0933551.1 amidase [Breoghania sp.]